MMWQTAVVGAALCAVGGSATPYLIRRLPEPPVDPEKPADEPDKLPYTELAQRRGLTLIGAVAGGVAGGLIGAVVGWKPVLILLWPLVPIGVLLSIVDAHTRLLPRIIVLPATAAALTYGLVRWAVTGSYDELVRGVIGLLAVRTFFWLLWFVRRAGMGFGDVRLSALLGFVLATVSWSALVVGIYASFLLFAVPFVVLAIVRRDRSMIKRSYPFGPFLVGGALVGVVVAGLTASGPL